MILKTDRIYSKEIEKYNIKNTAKMWQEIIDCDKSFPNYSSKL